MDSRRGSGHGRCANAATTPSSSRSGEPDCKVEHVDSRCARVTEATHQNDTPTPILPSRDILRPPIRALTRARYLGIGPGSLCVESFNLSGRNINVRYSLLA